MAHADHSNFATGLSKAESYEQVLEALEALLVSSWVSNLSNASSLLWHHFQAQAAPQSSVNWCGFYTASSQNPTLLLGPFQGKVACQEIQIGRGVCGAAAATRKTQVVPDVNSHPDHIACDGETQSEIVVPIATSSGEVLGVLDVDCTELNGFDSVDEKYLARVAELLVPSLSLRLH